MIPFEVTPAEVRRRLEAREPIVLIDVREPQEHAISRLDGSDLIPMRTVPANLGRLEELAENAVLVVFCHHGVRSLQVVNWLREQGVDSCQSMAGGIDRWSLEVDPSIPRY